MKRKEMKRNFTKRNLFMWPITNLIKIAIIIQIFLLILVLIGIVIRRSDKYIVENLIGMFLFLIFMWLIVIFGIASYRTYKVLYWLRRQEKFLQVNFEKELEGKEIQGNSMEAMYRDDNWFISYAGSYINVFHRKYITGIASITHYQYRQDIVVYTADGKKAVFTAPNMYASAVPKFKGWCNRKRKEEKE